MYTRWKRGGTIRLVDALAVKDHNSMPIGACVDVRQIGNGTFSTFGILYFVFCLLLPRWTRRHLSLFDCIHETLQQEKSKRHCG